jgi:hypothetical protein
MTVSPEYTRNMPFYRFYQAPEVFVEEMNGGPLGWGYPPDHSWRHYIVTIGVTIIQEAPRHMAAPGPVSNLPFKNEDIVNVDLKLVARNPSKS